MQKTYQSTLQVETKPKDVLEDAANLIEKARYDDAFGLIENDSSIEALKLKSEIKAKSGDYKSAVKYLDEAINLKADDDVLLKKADVLYRWAKVAYFPECNFELALDLVSRALDIDDESDDAMEYWFLKGEICQSQERHIEARRCFLRAEKRFDELEALESELAVFEAHKNDVLINITGVNFYRGLEPFEVGRIFDLRRDDDNEHDPDAVACIQDGEIVGYVANSEYTLINDVKGASQIRRRITDESKAEVLLIFQREFVIAKVMF